MEYYGMCNIGHNPTFNFQNDIRVEVHIFGVDFNIYNEEIEIQFLAHIRDEIKFESVDSLKNQLMKDKKECLRLVSLRK
jgi:riboflavin kinase/FMN adenylyltransferase